MSKADLTKRALADAFAQELRITPFRRISVSKVTERCGLSRQTFYYHFTDLYALVAWMYEQEALEAIGDDKTYDTWQQGLLAILERLLARRDFIMRTTHAVDANMVMGFLRDRVGRLLRNVVDEECAGLNVSESDRALVAKFYAAGIIDVVWSWVQDGMIQPPQELVRRLNLVILGDIPAAVKRLAV